MELKLSPTVSRKGSKNSGTRWSPDFCSFCSFLISCFALCDSSNYDLKYSMLDLFYSSEFLI